jgi:hypothetical protein
MVGMALVVSEPLEESEKHAQQERRRQLALSYLLKPIQLLQIPGGAACQEKNSEW